MSSLFDSLSSDKVVNSIVNEDSSDFPIKIAIYRDEVVNNYTRYGQSLNQSICKIASEDKLNDDQISRIVEEVNTQVYLIKYAQMKQHPDRDVVFDLASLSGVKTPEKVAHIEKKASLENNDGDDKMNFLNSSIGSTPSLGFDKVIERDFTSEKLASDISNLDTNIKTMTTEFANDVYGLADYFIKYDRMYKDAQESFDSMCKGASIHKKDQIIIKEAITQKINQMKEYKELSSDYTLNIELADIEKEAEFSLGKYSMTEKIAKKTQSNSSTPIIVTDNGKIIKSVNDLIGAAKEVQNKREKIVALKAQKAEMQKKVI